MTAPQISALPTPPSRSNSPDVFSARADAFVAALPAFRNEANVVADYIDERVGAAFDAGLENVPQLAEDAVEAAEVATTQAGAATSAAASALNDRNAVNAALAQASDSPITYVGIYFDSKKLVADLNDGAVIYIVKDERFDPPLSTLNRVNKDPSGSLVIDFIEDSYQSDDIVSFIGFDAPQLLSVPAAISSLGFLGAFAVGSNYFYFHNGSQWLRTEGVSF